MLLLIGEAIVHLATLMDAEMLVATRRATGQIDLFPFRPNLPKIGCRFWAKGGGKTERLTVDWKRALQSAHLGRGSISRAAMDVTCAA